MWQKFLAFLKKMFHVEHKVETNTPQPQAVPAPEGVINLELLAKNLQKFSLYKPTQLPGFKLIINKWYNMGVSDDIRQLSYILATTMHETAHTMKPVTEYGSAAYLKAKPYWPYIGRGYVQLTWRENYKKYGIEQTPEKALDPDFSAHILIDGMVRGVFTGKKLGDYFNSHKDDPVNARRIVNIVDRAELIAGYHTELLKILKDSMNSSELRLA